MTRSTISRLLGRRAPEPPELAAALDRLDQLAAANPSLREAGALQAALLRASYAEPAQAGAVNLTPGQAAEKLDDGVPLLRGEPVPLSMAALEATLVRLCAAAREHGGTPGSADEIAAALKAGALRIDALVQAVLDGQLAPLHERAAELGLDGEMLGTLLRFSLFPTLQRLAAQLDPLRAAAPWRQGYCPICGSWPLLGEHRGLEQARFLRCGLCAAEWPIDRLLCPYCGSRDHQDLGYLHVEGADQQRAVTCERCRGYLKVLASLAAIPPLELAVHDLATIHLDLIAVERGFGAPA